MSFVAGFSKTLARRGLAMASSGARRTVRTVPRLGSKEEMEAEAVAQIRARLAYQKELEAANPHKSFEEEWHEMWNWVKISVYICVPLCLTMLVKDQVMIEHEHRPEGDLPEYMGIRHKEFPWECDQCDLFDLGCWKKCRADKA